MVDGTKFGIAAKRLKSVPALEEHVRKAAKQIQKAGLPGIIALDTCLALNPENEPILARIPDDQFGALYNQELHRFLDRHHRRIYEWVDGKGVRGVVFHDHLVRPTTDDDWELASMTVTLLTAHDDGERREFASFSERYVSGLPNLQRL